MIPLRDDVPTRLRPVLTVALIAANVAAFAYEVSRDPRGPEPEALRALVATWGLVPRDFVHGVLGGGRAPLHVWLSPVTSMFLHGGALHLAGNLLYLWIFGNNVEDLLGRTRFVGFYLACGLAAAATHLAAQPDATAPVIGASGAVSGVLGAYAVSYPRARVRTLVPIGFFLMTLYVPAILFLLFWFALQVVSGAVQTPAGGAGVAWWAHVGGFVAGVALARPMRLHPPVRARIAI